jgi:NAD(P)-dependent dehydrogenase (short-subunit alcohol dehydrogenase family)
MNADFKGSTVVVTGAGRGIGRAATLAFAKAGASLALCARSAEVEETARAAEALGAKVIARRLSVADETAVDAFVADAVKAFGRIDALINNAGVLGPRASVLDTAAADWREALEVNATGAFLMLRACARAMTAGGAVVNMSSGAGRRGAAGVSAYCASKFALEGLTQAAAEDLKARGVRVNALNPRPTRTAMRAAYAPDEDPGTLKTPDEMSWAVLELAVKTGETGKTYDVDVPARRLVAA